MSDSETDTQRRLKELERQMDEAISQIHKLQREIRELRRSGKGKP